MPVTKPVVAAPTASAPIPADDSKDQPPPLDGSFKTEIDVRAMTLLDDGRPAFSSPKGLVRIWDPNAAETEPLDLPSDVPFGSSGTSSESQRTIISIGLLPGGSIAVASTLDGRLLVEEVDPVTGGSERGGFYSDHLTASPEVVFVSGSRAAIGSTEGRVSIDPVGDVGIQVSTGHSGAVLAIAELPNGLFASGGDDGTVRIWDPETGIEADNLQVLADHSDAVTTLAVLPDGRIVSGSADTTVQVWDPQQPSLGRQVFTGHSDVVTSLTVLPDGRIASGSADTTVQVWDPDEPDLEPDLFDGHTGAVTALVVLPDQRMASGSTDATIRFWTPRTVRSTGAAVPAESEAKTEPTDAGPAPTIAEPSAEEDIPRITVENRPTVVKCEGGGPDFPPNRIQTDLALGSFLSPDAAFLALWESQNSNLHEIDRFVRLDAPDGSVNYAVPLTVVLPLGSEPIDEALALVVVRSTNSGRYYADSWEIVGC